MIWSRGGLRGGFSGRFRTAHRHSGPPGVQLPQLSQYQYTVFGRLSPLHINGVIFGLFTTVIFGLFYYMVPKITGVRLYREEWGRPLILLWNLALSAGFIGIAAGYNNGLEVAEFPGGGGGALAGVCHHCFPDLHDHRAPQGRDALRLALVHNRRSGLDQRQSDAGLFHPALCG